MKYLLDTDVISQRLKPIPNARVMAWMQQVDVRDLYLSSMTLFEIRTGIESMDPGKKRNAIDRWLVQDLLPVFQDRILPVDAAVANECGLLVARSIQAGHTPGVEDALIAATAIVHRLELATLNRKHFEKLGVSLVDLR